MKLLEDFKFFKSHGLQKEERERGDLIEFIEVSVRNRIENEDRLIDPSLLLERLVYPRGSELMDLSKELEWGLGV